MKAEFALFLPGDVFTHVILLLGLLIVHPAGGKLLSKPSTTGGVTRFTTENDLLNVSFKGSVSPVPELLTGLPTYALMICEPELAVPAGNVMLALAPAFIVWLK